MTNRVNGKIYIGQTRKSLSVRWKKHVEAAKYPRKHKQVLHLALQKYGPEAFLVEALSSHKSQDEADQAEKALIAELRSTTPEIGYNRAVGGRVNFMKKCRKGLHDLDGSFCKICAAEYKRNWKKGQDLYLYAKKFRDEKMRQIKSDPKLYAEYLEQARQRAARHLERVRSDPERYAAYLTKVRERDTRKRAQPHG